MPPRAGGATRDIAPSLRTECSGARRAALQPTEPSEGGSVRVDRRSEAATLKDGDPFSGCMTSRARPLDLVRITGFPQLFHEFADKTGALDAQFEVGIFRRHA